MDKSKYGKTNRFQLDLNEESREQLNLIANTFNQRSDAATVRMCLEICSQMITDLGSQDTTEVVDKIMSAIRLYIAIINNTQRGDAIEIRNIRNEVKYKIPAEMILR